MRYRIFNSEESISSCILDFSRPYIIARKTIDVLCFQANNLCQRLSSDSNIAIWFYLLKKKSNWPLFNAGLFQIPSSGLFLTMTRPRTAASSVRRWASSSGMCCTCWTVGTRSGGRPVRSAPRTRLRRSASSPASTGQTNCELTHAHQLQHLV